MPTSIRLPDYIENRLNHLSKETGRSKAYYIREAILEYMDDLEDIYLAEKVLERVRSGKEKIYTMEEVKKHLGLAS